MLDLMAFTSAIFSVILLYTWVLDYRLPRVTVNLITGIVAALGIWHAIRTREWGFDRRAFLPALRMVALFTIPGVLVILLAGIWLGTLHDRRDFLGSLGWLMVWGGAQQWILQTVVLREAQRATSPPAGIVLAALLFAAVHLPNPFLTAVTFVSGLAWCATYARYPTILPLAWSHGLGTLAILYAFDPALTGRLRVGYSYLLLDQ
jgi:membrane protease YdiL (CAAX protease family)